MSGGDSKRPPSEMPPRRQSSPSVRPPASVRAGGIFSSPSPPSFGTPAPERPERTDRIGRDPSSPRPPPRVSFPSMKLGAVDYALASAARRVVEGALGVVRGEHVVLIVDRSRRDVGTALLDVAREIGADPIVHEIESHGERPHRQLPEAIRSALRRAQASLVNIGFDDSEIGMRHELLEAVKTLSLRHAHMVGVSRKSLIAGFSVDQGRIFTTTRAVRTRVRPESLFRVRTPGGTELEVRLDAGMRWTEHVGVIRPGKWENLPSGKLTTCPGAVKGVFVADASMGGQIGQEVGLLERSPVRIEIDGGVCKSVRCVDRAIQREVESFLRREHNLMRIGGICLGTNVGILSPTGDVVADQNLPGLHIVFGSSAASQTGAAWSTRSQLPLTGAVADVDLDGTPLLRAGRYMVT
jgi:aminopeptidase